MVANCTAFKNIYDKIPYYLSVDKALDRIKNGNSRQMVFEIRNTIDKERQDKLKRNLPSICFSGEFKERKDEEIIKHSGFIVLDFDNIFEVKEKKKEISESKFTYACWISPRNNGVKALVRIADGSKHREHFQALRKHFPDCDKSGVNQSRVCYESYDPEIYINKKSEVFKEVLVVEKVQVKNAVEDDYKIFDNIVKWLSNKGDAFISAERNNFIFKLASACCRFGMIQENCIGFIVNNFDVGSNKFSRDECEESIKSAYKSNATKFGTAQFDNDKLVDKTSRFEIEVTEDMLDQNIKPKDVIFGEDVKGEALSIYEYGFKSVEGIGIDKFDEMFKFKLGEITLLSGYGNYGKSSFLSWVLLMRCLVFGEKFAFFSPEENAVEFYFNLTEMLLGADCTPKNNPRPNSDMFQMAYDFVSKHIFYVYPKNTFPTPEYVKERFLELIIKERVNGVVIDPFNQLTNDYGKAGGRSDKYLETFLSDCTRFAQQNNIYFMIIAHPTKQRKDERGNYPCPDVFDIADGAMWNNKMDNILIYDRPNHQVDPMSDVCQFHTKKIRRQKIVGRKGEITFNFNRKIRRFLFDGVDHMSKAIEKSKFYNYKSSFNEQVSYDFQSYLKPLVEPKVKDEDEYPF